MVHEAAAKGFGTAAQEYARGRPDYPPQIIEWVTGTLMVGKDTRVLELGAGTGKFTRYLVDVGATVSAVEPVEAMRAKLVSALPTVEALPGSAEEIPLEDGTVDAVICATSFHWFATKPVLTEIARVLRPGGRLGLVWNFPDTTYPWVAALRELTKAYEGDTPRAYTGAWKEAFPVPEFGELEELSIPHRHTGRPREVILDRVLSSSVVARLGADDKAAVMAKVRAIMAEDDQLGQAALVTYPYITKAYSTVRR